MLNTNNKFNNKIIHYFNYNITSLLFIYKTNLFDKILKTTLNKKIKLLYINYYLKKTTIQNYIFNLLI